MDRYERTWIRRRERVLREQEELSLDSHQVSEELVDPDLAVGSDRTQRHGNATGAYLQSVPGTTSVPSPLVLLAALGLCEEKVEASCRSERRPLPLRPPAPWFALPLPLHEWILSLFPGM